MACNDLWQLSPHKGRRCTSAWPVLAVTSSRSDKCLPRPVCSLTSVCSDQGTQWPVHAVTSAHSGQCTQWAVRAVTSAHSDQCAQWPVRTVTSARSDSNWTALVLRYFSPYYHWGSFPSCRLFWWAPRSLQVYQAFSIVWSESASSQASKVNTIYTYKYYKY